jgi:hypothetical protein
VEQSLGVFGTLADSLFFLTQRLKGSSVEGCQCAATHERPEVGLAAYQIYSKTLDQLA